MELIKEFKGLKLFKESIIDCTNYIIYFNTKLLFKDNNYKIANAEFKRLRDKI